METNNLVLLKAEDINFEIDKDSLYVPSFIVEAPYRLKVKSPKAIILFVC